jgi:hypothetical protein
MLPVWVVDSVCSLRLCFAAAIVATFPYVYVHGPILPMFAVAITDTEGGHLERGLGAFIAE